MNTLQNQICWIPNEFLKEMSLLNTPIDSLKLTILWIDKHL